MIQKAMAWSLLIVSTCAGLVSFYWLAFAIWMSAHPLYDSPAWHMRVYERFAFMVMDGMVWVGSVVWIFRISRARGKGGVPPASAVVRWKRGDAEALNKSRF